MVSLVVNFRLHQRRGSQFGSLFPPSPYILTSSLPYLLFRSSRDENSVTATPLESALTNRDACNSFRICFYEKCRASPALSSLFSLLAQRVFHTSFPIIRFRALSQKHPGGGRSLSPTFRRWDVQAFRRILAIACGFGASYACSRGVMDEDEEANSVRSCNVGPVGNERECLARSERRTKWRTERCASRVAFDGGSRGHPDRWGERSAAEKPAHLCARGAH